LFQRTDLEQKCSEIVPENKNRTNMEKPENITIFGARIREAKAAILRLQEESFFDCHEKNNNINKIST
jgi:hypothetical protein